MLFKEINEKYTAKVAEYLAKGLTINTGTMSGTQGEIAHLDLTDGIDVYRILLESFREGWLDEGIHIVVGKVTDKVEPNSSDTWQTIWNDKLEIIDEEKFYEIGRGRHDEKFYGSEAEAQAAREKRHERYKNHDTSRKDKVITDPRAISLAVSKLKKELRKTRINKKEIEMKRVYGRSYQYTISYYSHTVRL